MIQAVVRFEAELDRGPLGRLEILEQRHVEIGDPVAADTGEPRRHRADVIRQRPRVVPLEVPGVEPARRHRRRKRNPAGSAQRGGGRDARRRVIHYGEPWLGQRSSRQIHRLAALLGAVYRSSEHAIQELVDNAWDAAALECLDSSP